MNIEQIPGCVCSVDGFRGLSLADMAPVPVWTDQSAAGNSPVNPNSGSQPAFVQSGLNSLPSVLFDGVDDFLTMDPLAGAISGVSQPFTIITAAAWGNVVGNRNLLSFAHALPGNPQHIDAGRLTTSANYMNFNVMNNADQQTSLAPRIAGQQQTPRIYTFVYDGQIMEVWFNEVRAAEAAYAGGALTVNQGTMGAVRSNAGPTSFANVLVGALAVFNRALLVTEWDTAVNIYSSLYNISL